MTFAFNLRSGKWETLNEHTPQPTMDHRGLLVMPDGLVLIGGMEKGQQVTSRVVIRPSRARPNRPSLEGSQLTGSTSRSNSWISTSCVP